MRISFLSNAYRFTVSRFGMMRRGFGRPRFRPLLMEAVVFGVGKAWRMQSRRFNAFCDEIDRLFCEQFDWPRSYTLDCGRDCWVDHYAEGMTPQECVTAEVEHWDC